MTSCHWLEGLIANTCAERHNVPGYGTGRTKAMGWNAMVGDIWQEIWGLERADVKFFTIHTDADLEHSELGWRTIGEYADKLHMVDQVVDACRRNLVVWETYFNGICYSGDALD